MPPPSAGLRLEGSLITALRTFERGLHLDVDAHLLRPEDARRIDRTECEDTNRVIGELRTLLRRRAARPC